MLLFVTQSLAFKLDCTEPRPAQRRRMFLALDDVPRVDALFAAHLQILQGQGHNTIKNTFHRLPFIYKQNLYISHPEPIVATDLALVLDLAIAVHLVGDKFDHLARKRQQLTQPAQRL